MPHQIIAIFDEVEEYLLAGICPIGMPHIEYILEVFDHASRDEVPKLKLQVVHSKALQYLEQLKRRVNANL